MDRGTPPIHRKVASIILGDQRQSRKALRNVAGKSDHMTSTLLVVLPVASMQITPNKVMLSNEDGSICKIEDTWLYH